MAHMAYEVDPNTGCHEWQKARNSRGYGVVWHDGRLRLAHRVSFFLAHGRWPAAGLVVDHICNNKGCVNAAHLRELTNSQNLRRASPPASPEQEAKRAYWRRTKAKSRGGDRNHVVQG